MRTYASLSALLVLASSGLCFSKEDPKHKDVEFPQEVVEETLPIVKLEKGIVDDIIVNAIIDEIIDTAAKPEKADHEKEKRGIKSIPSMPSESGSVIAPPFPWSGTGYSSSSVYGTVSSSRPPYPSGTGISSKPPPPGTGTGYSSSRVPYPTAPSSSCSVKPTGWYPSSSYKPTGYSSYSKSESWPYPPQYSKSESWPHPPHHSKSESWPHPPHHSKSESWPHPPQHSEPPTYPKPPTWSHPPPYAPPSASSSHHEVQSWSAHPQPPAHSKPPMPPMPPKSWASATCTPTAYHTSTPSCAADAWTCAPPVVTSSTWVETTEWEVKPTLTSCPESYVTSSWTTQSVWADEGQAEAWTTPVPVEETYTIPSSHSWGYPTLHTPTYVWSSKTWSHIMPEYTSSTVWGHTIKTAGPSETWGYSTHWTPVATTLRPVTPEAPEWTHAPAETPKWTIPATYIPTGMTTAWQSEASPVQWSEPPAVTPPPVQPPPPPAPKPEVPEPIPAPPPPPAPKPEPMAPAPAPVSAPAQPSLPAPAPPAPTEAPPMVMPSSRASITGPFLDFAIFAAFVAFAVLF